MDGKDGKAFNNRNVDNGPENGFKSLRVGRAIWNKEFRTKTAPPTKNRRADLFKTSLTSSEMGLTLGKMRVVRQFTICAILSSSFLAVNGRCPENMNKNEWKDDQTRGLTHAHPQIHPHAPSSWLIQAIPRAHPPDSQTLTSLTKEHPVHADAEGPEVAGEGVAGAAAQLLARSVTEDVPAVQRGVSGFPRGTLNHSSKHYLGGLVVKCTNIALCLCAKNIK